VGQQASPLMTVNIAVLWDVTPCTFTEICERFGWTCCFHIQGMKTNYVEHKEGTRLVPLLNIETAGSTDILVMWENAASHPIRESFLRPVDAFVPTWCQPLAEESWTYLLGELIHHYLWWMICGWTYVGARRYQPQEHGMHHHVRPIDPQFDCLRPVRFVGRLFKFDILLSKLFSDVDVFVTPKP
jgi:hypothetical protein